MEFVGLFIAVSILVFIGSVGTTLVTGYRDQAKKIANLEHEIILLEKRQDSYHRMIERRDEAIKASACKDQILHWVSNPDEIPKPFDPFNQLQGPL